MPKSLTNDQTNMPNQRLILIETGYGTGILFDQKDTIQAYQILSRATFVHARNDQPITPTGEDMNIKLIATTRLALVEDAESSHAPAPHPIEKEIPF